MDDNNLHDNDIDDNVAVSLENKVIEPELEVVTDKINDVVLDETNFEEKLHYESYAFNENTNLLHDEEPVKRKKRPFRFMMILLLVVIVGGFSSGVGYKVADFYILGNQPEVSYKYVTEFSQSINTETNTQLTYSITDIAKLVEPSLVSITNIITQNGFFGDTTGATSGSGVIFDITTENIYILTNNHVITDSTELSVNFFGNEKYAAKIIGSDSDTDLAVICVDITDIAEKTFNKIKPIKFGDSDKLKVGETAIAIGNPLGYNNTVTVGIVSALDRFISSDLNALSLIQTDAAINPGNSGGALVNDQGELIGINTIKISDTSVEGIGFAIPINSAIPILEEILEKGYVSKPFIGIWGSEVTKEAAKKYNIPFGVVVSDTIANSPAFESGLRKYDIIVKIDEHTITSMEDLNRVLSLYNIGDSINLEIKREINKKLKTIFLELKIGDRNDYKN